MASPSLPFALSVYAEPLVEGNRVLLVGDSSVGLHETLVAMGARLVHVYDPVPERALAQAAPEDRTVSLRTLPDGDFDVRDGAFDLAIVPDLASVPEPAALLSRLRRVVGPEGAVLCAARNRETAESGEASLDYYDLYEMLSLQFQSVRMLAEMPFSGVTIAELGVAEVEGVRVDTQLAPPAGAPHAFVALASQGDVALDPYAVVQLPAPPQTAPASDTSLTVELAEARLRADTLRAQLADMVEGQAEQARVVEEARRAGMALEAEHDRASRLERALAHEQQVRERLAVELAAVQPGEAIARERIGALEAGVELAEQTIVTLRERLGQLEAWAAERDARVSELETALRDRDDRAALLAAELDVLREAPPPDEPDEPDEAYEAELHRLEAKLAGRGEAVRVLQREAARREKIIRELLLRLEELTHGHAPAEPAVAPELLQENEELRKKLDALALVAARQRSELEASAWRAGELERALLEAHRRVAQSAPSPVTPPAEVAVAEAAGDEPPEHAELSSLREELSVLRQALAQEHAERRRAESGEELEHARAELERQAVLIAELSKEDSLTPGQR